MRLAHQPLNFIDFMTDRTKVNPTVKAGVLGTAWKARTEPNMVHHAAKLVQFGYDRFFACKDIITRINNLRSKHGHKNAGLGIRPVHLVLHDAISGFDSEAGMDKCGSIAINLCGRYGWIDKHGQLWYVPMLVVIYHELGHYLQYLSNPDEYERAANYEQRTGMHLLDAMNLPDNEWPLCDELGIGRRELYLDMHELHHPSFKGKKLHYSKRLPRDKSYELAIEPPEVRRQRENEERLRLEAAGVEAPKGGNCAFCGSPFPTNMKRRMHELSCPNKH